MLIVIIQAYNNLRMVSIKFPKENDILSFFFMGYS